MRLDHKTQASFDSATARLWHRGNRAPTAEQVLAEFNAVVFAGINHEVKLSAGQLKKLGDWISAKVEQLEDDERWIAGKVK